MAHSPGFVMEQIVIPATKKNEILWPIISLIMAEMMDMFRGRKEPSNDALHNKAMLSNISIFVGSGVPQTANHNISLCGDISPALPFMRLSASLTGCMTWEKRKRIALKVSFFAPRIRGGIGWLATATFTDSVGSFFWGWNVVRLWGMSLLHGKAGVMTLQEPLISIFIEPIRFQGLSATTFTQTAIHALHGSRSMKRCQA